MSTKSPTFSPGAVSKPNVNKHPPALPPMAKIVVLGAGAFGGWTALMLQEKGYHVTLVDPWGPGNSRSSSGGETRLIRMIYGGDGFYTRLSARSYELWERYQRKFNKRCLYPSGNLWMSNSYDPLIAQACEILKEEGLPFEELDKQKAAQAFPAIKFDSMDHIVHEKKTGYLMARESCALVRQYFVRNGGTYLRKMPLADSLLADGHLLEFTDRSQLKADAFIWACGPWLATLFPDWISKHLTITRQEVYYFGAPQEYITTLETLPTWIMQEEDASYYGVPSTNYRGFKIATDQRGPYIDPSAGDRNITSSAMEKARAFLRDHFHQMINAPLLESRVCQYSNTVDGHFIFDQHPDWPNIFALGGGSGHGFKHGPAVGEKIMHVLSGDQPMPSEWLLPKIEG